jgi:hypothetical protein
MVTYDQIEEYVFRVFGLKIHHRCYIADVKARHRLTTRLSHNRRSADQRVVPCPPAMVAPIEAALRHFGAISDGLPSVSSCRA